MNCPNPECEGEIQRSMVPNCGTCNNCKLSCIRCCDSRENPTCEEWNVATARFCRGCGQGFLINHWLKSIEDYFEGETFFQTVNKKANLYETIDLKPFYGNSQPGFTLYNTGNFLFFLSSDGRLFPITSKSNPHLISKNSKYRDWKASCVNSYIVIYCSKQWHLIAQNSLSVISNLSSIQNPSPSCQWESPSPEMTILPNQKPLIWDIPGKYTLVAWVTISTKKEGFELHQRTITDQGSKYSDLPIIPLADFTDDNFFCWEKSPYSENPKVILACKKGLFEIDLSASNEGLPNQVKILTEFSQKSWWIDPLFKVWTPDILMSAFLFRLDPPEILIGLDSMSPESDREVVGINPMKGNITTYGAKNAPGKPICLKGKRGFFSLNKTEIHECSFLSTSRQISNDDINHQCLGALIAGDLFIYWGSFFDGSKSLRKLEIKSLSNSHPRFSFPALTGTFISNPVVSCDGIWYLEICSDNQLKIWLLNTEPKI